MDSVLTADQFLIEEIFDSGATLLVDKPLGWTSFDVVNKIRWAIKNLLGVKRYKVGHAGTLDPLATGLLIICIGKHTKKIESYQGLDKRYTGEIKMFETTISFDSEFQPDQYFPFKNIQKDELMKCAESFIGTIEQYPPIFSALKKNGKALYKLARKGQVTQQDVEPRSVRIDSFDIVNYNLPIIKFEVQCSKGTYIRSLAHDFGKCLGSGAHLLSLRRTAIGHYNIDNAWKLEDLITSINHVRLSSIA